MKFESKFCLVWLDLLLFSHLFWYHSCIIHHHDICKRINMDIVRVFEDIVVLNTNWNLSQNFVLINFFLPLFDHLFWYHSRIIHNHDVCKRINTDIVQVFEDIIVLNTNEKLSWKFVLIYLFLPTFQLFFLYHSRIIHNHDVCKRINTDIEDIAALNTIQ